MGGEEVCSMWFQGTICLWWEWEVADLQGLRDKWGHRKDEWSICGLVDGHTSIKLKRKGPILRWSGVNMTILSLSRNEELICWLDSRHFRLTPLRTRPAPTSHPSSLSPSNCCAFVTWAWAFLWFHHRLWWETEPPPHERRREGGKKSLL